MLDSLKKLPCNRRSVGENFCLPAGCSRFQGALAVKRCRVPWSQVVRLAADGARRSGGTGRGGVVCQLQSMFAACVGSAQLARAALPSTPLLLLARPPCSASWKHTLWAKEGTCARSPEPAPAACCLGRGFPKHAFGMVTWCSGALWLSAMQVASEGSAWDWGWN